MPTVRIELTTLSQRGVLVIRSTTEPSGLNRHVMIDYWSVVFLPWRCKKYIYRLQIEYLDGSVSQMVCEAELQKFSRCGMGQGALTFANIFWGQDGKGGEYVMLLTVQMQGLKNVYQLCIVIAYLPVSQECRGHVPVGDGSRFCKGSKWKQQGESFHIMSLRSI